MKGGFRTLSVTHRVGESITGTSLWGSRFERVPVGRTFPGLRKVEDAEAILRCGFTDPWMPIELNMVNSESIRARLRQRLLIDSHTEGWLHPDSLLRSHPSVGYLPPELLCTPNTKGLKALSESSVSSEAVVRLRLNDPPTVDGTVDWLSVTSENIVGDGTFWTQMAKSHLYPTWIGDLLARGENVRLSLMAPPVPVLNAELAKSADLQFELNAAASTLMKPLSGSQPSIRPLYSIHVHPSALGCPGLLQSALSRLRLAMAGSEYGFVGVHLAFTDLGAVGFEGAPAIRTAKDLATKAAGIARESGRFLIVSDTGPVGPAFLDLGAAFATYGMGMSMSRTYRMVRAPKKQTPTTRKRVHESKYGKTLGGPWNYVLLRYRDVKAQGWKLEDPTEKFASEVPPSLRYGPEDRYRIDFSKPYNTAVQEVLNDLRERELNIEGNSRPGKASLGKSDDPSIAPWA